MTVKEIEQIADALLDKWDDLQAEADQQAQLYQDPEAGAHHMRIVVIETIRAVLQKAARDKRLRAHVVRGRMADYRPHDE